MKKKHKRELDRFWDLQGAVNLAQNKRMMVMLKTMSRLGGIQEAYKVLGEIEEVKRLLEGAKSEGEAEKAA